MTIHTRSFTIERRAIPMGQAMARRAGRPRKTNVVRDASGKSRGEIVDFSVVLNQPHRRGAKDPKSHMLGFPLGRLRLNNDISEDQFRAGDEWAGIVARYAVTMGIPSGSPKSGAMADRVSSGFYTWDSGQTGEDREKQIQRTRGAYNQCHDTLAELGRVLCRDRQIIIAMRKVCIDERYPNEIELGDLRLGLNAIARVLHIGGK